MQIDHYEQFLSFLYRTPSQLNKNNEQKTIDTKDCWGEHPYNDTLLASVSNSLPLRCRRKGNETLNLNFKGVISVPSGSVK